MTHEELLEQLNWAIQEYDRAYDNTNYYYTALRAVVGLHHEHTSGSGDIYCYNCQQKYPCLTIQAIEKELG
jgi:hypothetical protein